MFIYFKVTRQRTATKKRMREKFNLTTIKSTTTTTTTTCVYIYVYDDFFTINVCAGRLKIFEFIFFVILPFPLY